MIWRNRPDDEKFPDLQSLHSATLQRAEESRVEILPCGELEFEGEQLSREVDRITLKTPTARLINDVDLTPTHWSFGQLCTKADCYAPWAREKSHPTIVTTALNWGLQIRNPNERVKLTARNGTLRSATGPDYGTVYDHELADAIGNIIGPDWKIPREVTKHTAGTTLYSSDRDSFIFMVNQNQVIRIPDTHGNLREYYRGFIAWNSEVGYKTVGFNTFYFDGICANRTIYNMTGSRVVKVKHTKNAPLRFIREARPILEAYVNSSPQREEEIFRNATRMKIGDKKEDVEKWLNDKGFNKAKASQIISQGIRDLNGELPYTLLDIVNAGTSHAKSITHTDSRVQYEEDVSKLLRLAA